MVGKKCSCFYGGPGEVSIIKDCSNRHLTSKAHLERKHLMLEGKGFQSSKPRTINNKLLNQYEYMLSKIQTVNTSLI